MGQRRDHEPNPSTQTPDLRWFLLISIAIHALLLWRWSLAPLSEPSVPAALKTRLVPGSSYLSAEKPAPPGDQGRPVQGRPIARQGKPFSQERMDPSDPSIPDRERTTGAAGGTASTTGGTPLPDGGTSNAGAGNFPVAPGGTSPGAGGAPSGAGGNPPAPAIFREVAAKQTLREPKVPPRVRRSPSHPSTATDFMVLISWKLTTMFLRE